MHCRRCGGLLLSERLHDLCGNALEIIEIQKCVACSRLFEPNREYGVLATGETGNAPGEVKGSGRYLNTVGGGKSWTSPDTSQVEL